MLVRPRSGLDGSTAAGDTRGMPDPWTRVDPLGEALHFLRLSGVFYCRSELTAPWGLDLPPFPSSMMFHVVTRGECVLDVAGVAPSPLRVGELALVPHGEGHRILSAAGASAAPLFDVPREGLSERFEVLRHGGGGAPSTVICGVVRFDDPASAQLVRHLPRLIRMDAWDAPELEWMQSTLRLLAAEARELRAGGEAVITRLADVLVVQAIRGWIARDPAARTGWLAALRDERIGRAIARVHRAPARPWTVAALAREAGMSRSAFAARFTHLVGEPAMRYVTRWRMLAAQARLERDADVTLGELAGECGYESEAAFHRAFQRVIGASPGAVRRRGRERAAGG
jgi:AraC-like DNA-binding protein